MDDGIEDEGGPAYSAVHCQQMNRSENTDSDDDGGDGDGASDKSASKSAPRSGQGGARLDESGKSKAGKKSAGDKLRNGAFILKGQVSLSSCFSSLSSAACSSIPAAPKRQRQEDEPQVGAAGRTAQKSTARTTRTASTAEANSILSSRLPLPDFEALLDSLGTESQQNQHLRRAPQRRPIHQGAAHVRANANAPPATLPIELELRGLAAKLGSLVLKISTESEAASATLGQDRDAAISDIQSARDEAAKKVAELNSLLKVHSKLKVLRSDCVAILATGNVICLTCTEYVCEVPDTHSRGRGGGAGVAQSPNDDRTLAEQAAGGKNNAAGS